MVSAQATAIAFAPTTPGTPNRLDPMSLKPAAQQQQRARKKSATAASAAAANGSAKKTARKKEFVRSMEYWHRLCELFTSQYDGKMSQAAFLKSPVSGEDMKGTTSDQMSFGRNLKRYKAGTLQPGARFRERHPEFTFVETKIVEYLNLYLEDYDDNETCGLSWMHLQQKALEFATLVPPEEAAVYAKFTASPGWIDNVLRRNGFKRVKLNNQVNEGSSIQASSTTTQPQQHQQQQQTQPQHLQPPLPQQHYAAAAAAASTPEPAHHQQDNYHFTPMDDDDDDVDDDIRDTVAAAMVAQHNETGPIMNLEQAEACIDKLTDYGKDLKMDTEAMGHLYIFAHLLRKQAVRQSALPPTPQTNRHNNNSNNNSDRFFAAL